MYQYCILQDIHLSYGNGRLYDNKQYSTHSYGRSENDITIENVASKNTVDTFSTNGQEYAYLLFSPSKIVTVAV